MHVTLYKLFFFKLIANIQLQKSSLKGQTMSKSHPRLYSVQFIQTQTTTRYSHYQKFEPPINQIDGLQNPTTLFSFPNNKFDIHSFVSNMDNI